MKKDFFMWPGAGCEENAHHPNSQERRASAGAHPADPKVQSWFGQVPGGHAPNSCPACLDPAEGHRDARNE